MIIMVHSIERENGGEVEDKERIVRYLLRKGNICNTYKVARELGMERWDVLESLQELAQEKKVKLSHGSVKAVTEGIKRDDDLKTQSEIEELKERMNKLEKVLQFTFGQLIESIQMGYGKMSTKKQSKEENNPENEE